MHFTVSESPDRNGRGLAFWTQQTGGGCVIPPAAAQTEASHVTGHSGIAASISSIRRIVSCKATTIFW